MTFRRFFPALLGILLLGVLGFEEARAQGTAALVPEDAEMLALDRQAREFLQKIAQDQAPEAFRELLADNPWLEGAKGREALDNLAHKAADIKGTYGDCQEVERVEVRKLGTRIIVLRYLYLCERCPVVWHFFFYHPPQRRDTGASAPAPWQALSVRFDTDLERLLH